MIASLLSEEWGGFKYSTSRRNHSPNIIFVTLGVFFVTHGVFSTMQAQLLSVLVAVSRNPNCCALLSSRAQSVS